MNFEDQIFILYKKQTSLLNLHLHPLQKQLPLPLPNTHSRHPHPLVVLIGDWWSKFCSGGSPFHRQPPATATPHLPSSYAQHTPL
ncbi:hypothetical protein HanIR_Chr09g0444431 [Helianthus annuus]|nr:hypothetical protein HanIR_Chr09g0444431 [Helianthus annuus]